MIKYFIVLLLFLPYCYRLNVTIHKIELPPVFHKYNISCDRGFVTGKKDISIHVDSCKQYGNFRDMKECFIQVDQLYFICKIVKKYVYDMYSTTIERTRCDRKTFYMFMPSEDVAREEILIKYENLLKEIPNTLDYRRIWLW